MLCLSLPIKFPEEKSWNKRLVFWNSRSYGASSSDSKFLKIRTAFLKERRNFGGLAKTWKKTLFVRLL